MLSTNPAHVNLSRAAAALTSPPCAPPEAALLALAEALASPTPATLHALAWQCMAVGAAMLDEDPEGVERPALTDAEGWAAARASAAELATVAAELLGATTVEAVDDLPAGVAGIVVDGAGYVARP